MLARQASEHKPFSKPTVSAMSINTSSHTKNGVYAVAVPIAIGLVAVGYAILRTKPKKLHEIDLVTGRKCHFSAEELNAKRAEKRQWPIGKKILHWLFL